MHRVRAAAPLPGAFFRQPGDGDHFEMGEEESFTNDEIIDPDVPHRPLRRRGRRGGAQTFKAVRAGSSASDKRWRSGQVPAPPIFDPDIENDPYCLRHYRVRLHRWVRITREFLPGNEQALRAREAMRGEAELELEEIGDDRYDHADGIARLLADLETSFGEKELFRQGGVIREFEAIGRVQGESVTAFVRRFRLIERKLQDNRVPAYPEEARVIKLLDGLRLDERATSALLLAAGNKYNMQAIQDAIRIQSPAGMSVTGLPHGTGHGSRRKTSSSTARPGRGRWNAWQAEAVFGEAYDDSEIPQDVPYDQSEENYADEDFDYAYDEEDFAETYHLETVPEETVTEDTPLPASAEPANLNDVVDALTVTSKRLAELTQARGYYAVGKSGKSKGKGRGKDKGKGKGKAGKSGNKGVGRGTTSPPRASTSSSSSSATSSKGRGKPSITGTKQNFADQQQRLRDATCLGCGSAGHWLRDCPVVSRHSAQLTTAGCTLDAQGAVLESWMVNHQGRAEKCDGYVLPEVVATLEGMTEASTTSTAQPPLCLCGPHEGVSVIPHNPAIMLQYAKHDAALMIADTGCQRQVAGVQWHEHRSTEILPLKPLPLPEKCSFSFGPNRGVQSQGRYYYPAGLGGSFVALGVSCVDVNAPALFSRPSFAALGAVPNIVTGIMHYTALGVTSPLYLSSCGHLAIRVDEWGDEPFEWPSLPEGYTSDVWTPAPVLLESATLASPDHPAAPPPHAKADLSASSMASTVAAASPERLRVRVRRGADGATLLRHQPDEQLSRPGAPELFPSSNGHHDVEFLGSPHAPVHGRSKSVPQRPDHMFTSVGHQGLWRCRPQGKDLRPVRGEMGSAGEYPAQGSTKGPSYGTNSHGPSWQSQGKGQHRGRGLFGRIATALTVLAAGLWTGTSSHHSDSEDEAWSQNPNTKADAPSAHRAMADELGGRGYGHCECPRELAERGRNPLRLQPSRGRQSQPPRVPAGRGRGFLTHEPNHQEVYANFNPHSLADAILDSRNDQYCVANAIPDNTNDLYAMQGTAVENDLFRDYVSNNNNDQAYLEFQRILENSHSADRPMMREDRGLRSLKTGVRKRLSGNVKALRQLFDVERRAQSFHVHQARALRRHRLDVVEIYGGFANITAEALSRGLRAAQPVDQVHGVRLDRPADHDRLRRLLLQQLPFLTVYEIRCDAWTNIQNLNYSPEEIAVLRQEQLMHINNMRQTIEALHREGCHFLVENPWGTSFWNQDDVKALLRLPGAELRRGSMCQFGLRGRQGLLMRKDTGWLSDLPAVLQAVGKVCRHDHEHEDVLGQTSRAQIYTRKLARAIIRGVELELHERGDERFTLTAPSSTSWTTGLSVADNELLDDTWPTPWAPAADIGEFHIYYVDIVRDQVAWQPLLQEALERLQNKVATSAMVKEGTAFFEQIRALVPWTIHQAQIARTPKIRRLPPNLLLNKPVTHRAAILQYPDGKIVFETESIEDFGKQPGARFSHPVKLAIFVYGEAPSETFNPDEAALPERDGKRNPSAEVQPEDILLPGRPGHADIRFDVSDSVVPRWMKNVLRRVHVNLGHPSNEALTRHLAQAGASGPALHGAKHLQCATCARTKPPHAPRPAKTFQPRMFNDRLQADIIYVKNVAKDVFTYLSLVDEATTYHVLEPLPDRSEDTVIKAFTRGWFRYLGLPRELLVDAEGAFRSYGFENLAGQCGIRLRHVPVCSC